ncbi:family 2 glycosyl transferase [Calothrix sp. NIES-4071]|nr:family 2 glycosyl transferase [Calothrix sp. NIES-4071]BAZ58962.1 family 2 glycosyl transferase [Calothrix sp. NIES-4105]
MIKQSEHVLLSMESYQYLFTVFTPTYNRAYELHRVYESLEAQTYRDFEWLIVDDGSTDGTCELVKQWQKTASFPIRYICQDNSGKHIAFNRGVREAKGELFINLDSDDSCVPEALERFKYHWDTIPENQKKYFSDVTCLCKDRYGKVMGRTLPFDSIDSNWLEIRYRYKVVHEKWGFHRTDVLKQFPFTEQVKQTYIPETLVWHKISRKYKTRFINEHLRIYWTDTLSIMRGGNVKSAAIGNRIMHQTILNEEVDWLRFDPLSFFRSAIHYSRFSFHRCISISEQFKQVQTVLGKVLWFVNLPIGYAVYLKDQLLY